MALLKVKQLWRGSLLFRRLTAVTVFALTALAVYLGSNIPRTVSLPEDDLNARGVARLGEEEIVLDRPEIGAGELVLSYAGSKNEIGDLWLENATLDERSQRMLFAGAPAGAPGRISYTTGGVPDVTKSGDTCHTTIAVRRAPGSTDVDALKLYQTDEMAGPQRFRQVVLDAGKAAMEVEVHTDPPEEGTGSRPVECRKVLTVGGGAPIALPSIPIRMVVQEGKIDLHFNPVNPALAIWTGPEQTFEAVSLGKGSVRARGVKIVAMRRAKAPQLDVRGARPSDGITMSRLKIGADKLKVDIGRTTEAAKVRANGASVYNYDLIAAIQKNPILAIPLGALAPALWIWVRKNLFPNRKSDGAADSP
jgi:hypothetical protein